VPTDKTKKNHEADVTQVLEVLKKCFPHWANQFKSRWKSEEICRILSSFSLFQVLGTTNLLIVLPVSLLQKILAKQNKHFVRVFGFEMLLVFIDSIFQTENIKEVSSPLLSSPLFSSPSLRIIQFNSLGCSLQNAPGLE
jgi:hypothetical protein